MTEAEQTAYAVADWLTGCKGNSHDHRQLREAVRAILRQHGEPTYRNKAASKLKGALVQKGRVDALIEIVKEQGAPNAVWVDLLSWRERVLHEIEYYTLATLNPLAGDLS